MTAFGTFASFDHTSADKQQGRMPADIGLANKTNSSLVEQAWAFSPANYVKPVGMNELPGNAYGSGPRARQDDAILKSYEGSQRSAGLGTDVAASAPAPEVKSLRSILPNSSFGGRAADQTVNSKPVDLIDALSGQPNRYDVRQPTYLPGSPFAAGPYSLGVDRNAYVSPMARTETGPLPATRAAETARVEAPALTRPVETARIDATPVARPMETARVEAQPAAKPVETARVDTATPARSVDFASHPLFANINKEAKTNSFASNARMENPISMEALSRSIMNVDFSAPKGWSAFEQNKPKSNDPFAAANCYQSMEFAPDGTVKTTTTLPDLSASKIESSRADKSKDVALTDHLGRSTVEQRFDANGQLVSHTAFRFDHADAPQTPSQKTVLTATQTIETRMDGSGKVVASKIMPYSDLNATKSIA